MVLTEPTIRVWEDNPGTAVSMHSVVDTYLGKSWGIAAGITFWVLINCTLVSQLAKCGELAFVITGGGIDSRVGSLISAFIIAGASFRRSVGKINALATTGLFASFA